MIAIIGKPGSGKCDAWFKSFRGGAVTRSGFSDDTLSTRQRDAASNLRLMF